MGRRTNSKKKNKRKQDNRSDNTTPKRNKLEQTGESPEGQNLSESEETAMTTSKQTPLRRSARRVLIDQLDEEAASKNNNATMTSQGSIFVDPNTVKLAAKTIEQRAFERKQKLNLDNSESNHGGEVPNVLNNDKQASWLKQLAEFNEKRKREKIKNPEINNVVDDVERRIMPETNFQMEVDPGDELDFLYEDEEGSEIGEDQDSQDNEVSEGEIVSDDNDIPIETVTTPINLNCKKTNEVVDEIDQLRNNPDVKKFLELMQKGQGKKSIATPVSNNKKGQKNNCKSGQNGGNQRGRSRDRQSRGIEQNRTDAIQKRKCKQMGYNPNGTLIVCGPKKSPSDTTVYVPALKQRRFSNNLPPNVVKSPELIEDRIAETINQMRMTDFPGDMPGTSGLQRNSTTTAALNGPNNYVPATDHQQQQARSIAEQMVVNAERQKAAITAPTGRINMNIPNIMNIDPKLSVPLADLNFNDDNPGNYTQVSVHIDNTTADKIKIGGFMEIEKLGPRSRDIKPASNSLELIHRDGKTYFVPSNDREMVKVNNFAKWEQNFRVYASIYSSANPHRAAEIYQYIHTIYLASQSFQWDNVAYYDYYFRKLMADNPQRSWAKTYTQLWTLSMRDPLTFKTSNGHNSQGSSNYVRQANGKSSSFDNVCWRYNRNNCKKSAKDCKFEHRCGHCGIFNHSYLNCRKRNKSEGGSGDSNNAQQKKHKPSQSQN